MISCIPFNISMDPMEEGQVVEGDPNSFGDYDPAYEWPGDGGTGSDSLPEECQPESSDLSNRMKPSQLVFRFVVLRSSILPTKQRVAVVDAYTEVQLGRDAQLVGSVTPKIRLKEMEVSKIHATAYWDGARKEWSVVDMGSMHGTFLHAGSARLNSGDSSMRLSQPRTASIPRRLRHGDHLTIGSTTFMIHVHYNRRPCQDCTISGKDEIPLFPSKSKEAVKRSRDEASLDSDGPGPSKTSNTERDPKKALVMLKRSLLDSCVVSTIGTSSAPIGEYIDRAARRRRLHPSSLSDSPGVAPLPSTMTVKIVRPISAAWEPLPQTIISCPSMPLPDTNFGHRLLLKQGWAPGTALGLLSDSAEGRIGLVDPLELKSSKNRAGLGMELPMNSELEASSSSFSWKEREKMRRFEAHR